MPRLIYLFDEDFSINFPFISYSSIQFGRILLVMWNRDAVGLGATIIISSWTTSSLFDELIRLVAELSFCTISWVNTEEDTNNNTRRKA